METENKENKYWKANSIYPDTQVKCKACGKLKPANQFTYVGRKPLSRATAEGLWPENPKPILNSRRCDSCRKKQSKISRKLAKAYSHTRPADNKCACCGNVPPNGKQLVLDHDHSTEKFRGWICSACNTGIGWLGDTKESVLQAYNYLVQSEFNKSNGTILDFTKDEQPNSPKTRI